MYQISNIFLLQQDGKAVGWSNLLLIIGLLVFFYLFIILPQQKRQKKEREFQNNLKIGDMVVTIGGIYGKVVSLEEKYVLLEIAEDTHIKVARQAIRSLETA
jgi:preprotein translocase subunit YajC